MKSTFKILFYARKNYVNKDGEVCIMVRITVNGENTQFSSKLNVNPQMWDTKMNRAIGKSFQANQLNATLDEMKASLFNYYRDIERREFHVSAEKIRNAFLGITVKNQMLLVVFKKHNEDLLLRIGKGITKTAAVRYERTRKQLAIFMKQQYNIEDIALKEIKHNFITDFETYLLTVRDCAINTTAKYMRQLKHITTLAKNNGWLYADPFVNYKIRLEKVDRGYLTQEELNIIMQRKFSIKRLEQVKDIFVFACFTGLSYIDVKNLKEKNIRTSFDGELWVMKKRQKTNTESNILLLDIPKLIINKYKDKCSNNKVLPVSSNQRMNSYLKEIADLCGIEKNLTFHLARHTFATTVTLARGVPIETVSKMLGHTDIRTTQIYARITNSKISHDMHELAAKLQGMDKMLAL